MKRKTTPLGPPLGKPLDTADGIIEELSSRGDMRPFPADLYIRYDLGANAILSRQGRPLCSSREFGLYDSDICRA